MRTRIAAAFSLAIAIEDALHGDGSGWCRLFKFAPIFLNLSPHLSTNLKAKLQNFTDKTVHLAHGHHLNSSKPINLRKAIDNKLLVGYVSAAVRLIAFNNSIIKLSPETVKAFCLKHPMVPADTHQEFQSRTYSMREKFWIQKLSRRLELFV